MFDLRYSRQKVTRTISIIYAIYLLFLIIFMILLTDEYQRKKTEIN